MKLKRLSELFPMLWMSHPFKSVLILSDFTGAYIDRSAIIALEETAVFDKPYVRKSGLVGTGSCPAKFLEDVTIFPGRQFAAFGTREEALTWLVED
jgi:hypothetical protein